MCSKRKCRHRHDSPALIFYCSSRVTLHRIISRAHDPPSDSMLQIAIIVSPRLLSCRSIGGGQKILDVDQTREFENLHRR